MLVEKHSRLQGELRKMVEEQGQYVMMHDEVFRLRSDIGDLMTRYDKQCDDNVALKERVRLLDLSRSKEDKPIDTALAQELVAARVVSESTARRMELVENERDRVQRSLQETQVCSMLHCVVCSLCDEDTFDLQCICWVFQTLCVPASIFTWQGL